MGFFSRRKKETSAVITESSPDAYCPHCKTKLEPHPKRKKKCPDCGKDVYVRTDLFDKQKTHYLKHEDALALDMARDLQFSEKAFASAVNKAVKGQSFGDIVWGLVEQKKQKAARKGDWRYISQLTWKQARHLYESGRPYFHLLQVAFKAELEGYLSDDVTNYVEIMSCKDDRTCNKCRSQHGKVFTVKEAIEKMPLPVKCDNDEGWCRCCYASHYRRK